MVEFTMIMPKFIISVFFILTLVGGCILYFFFKVPPQSPQIIFGVLFLILIFLGLFFSLPFSYLSGKGKEGKVSPETLRSIYRVSLRRGLITGFVLTSFLALRYFGVFSPINLLLIVAFSLLVELYFSLK
jgi:predicted secreted protein